MPLVEGRLRPFGMAPSVVLEPLVCPEETGGVSGVRPLGVGGPYGEAIGYDQSLAVVEVGELAKEVDCSCSCSCVGAGLCKSLFMAMRYSERLWIGSRGCCYTKCPGRLGARTCFY